jgi:hypothetical protein
MLAVLNLALPTDLNLNQGPIDYKQDTPSLSIFPKYYSAPLSLAMALRETAQEFNYETITTFKGAIIVHDTISRGSLKHGSGLQTASVSHWTLHKPACLMYLACSLSMGITSNCCGSISCKLIQNYCLETMESVKYHTLVEKTLMTIL